MAETLELWEKPESKEINMIIGWRQWADAGSVSSGLPEYLIDQLQAQPVGNLRPDGFYLFQIPGTHDLVRPVIKFDEGFPEWLGSQRNEFFYAGDESRGLLIFLGDEPHMDIERYVDSILQAAKTFHVNKIIGVGGVYGELPYDKERVVSCIYSQRELKDELQGLAVTFSDYQGGASIGSYFCKRAVAQAIPFIEFYAFVPTYDFSNVAQAGSSIRIETDYMAWLGVMRRVSHLLGLDMDLSDLEAKSQELLAAMDARVEQVDAASPELGVRDYMRKLSTEFKETPFNPEDEYWEEELRRIFNKIDPDHPEE